jgi:hypothetical protein
VSLQAEQILCREEKQCALNDRIIKNGPQNENQRIATPFFSSLLEDRDEAFAALRRAESTGRPVGTAEFATGLERVLGRRIARRAPKPTKPTPAANVSHKQLNLLQ